MAKPHPGATRPTHPSHPQSNAGPTRGTVKSGAGGSASGPKVRNAHTTNTERTQHTEHTTHKETGAATRFARMHRRHPRLAALLPVALVMLALVTLVAVKVTGGSSGATGGASKVVAGGGVSTSGTSALPDEVLSNVTSISPATLAAIGSSNESAALTPTGLRSTLRANGKPEVLFIGAEYCPYCAAQRWAVVEALSRFGTFSGLRATHSSSSDIFPDTKTFSFYRSTYTSASVDFTSVELESNQASGSSYATLQTPTAAESALLTTYDAAPYTAQPGSIPFLDIGNKYVSVGAGFTPQVLHGLSMQQIADQLNDKNSPVAVAVDGEANRIVAAITAATGIKPDGPATSARPTPAPPAAPAVSTGSGDVAGS